MCAIIKEKPGPEVTVNALAPPQTAPCKVIDAASSSSIWMNVPPTVGTREAKRSTISVEGVMGYPAANRAPAAKAPSQQAWSPSMKCVPVSTPRGSAFICHLRSYFAGKNGKIGTVHPAQVTTAALFRSHDMRRMVALGIEGGRQREHLCRTKLHAEAAGFAVLDHDGNTSFCHGNSHLKCLEASTSLRSLCVAGVRLDVTLSTDVCDGCTPYWARSRANQRHPSNLVAQGDRGVSG